MVKLIVGDDRLKIFVKSEALSMLKDAELVSWYAIDGKLSCFWRHPVYLYSLVLSVTDPLTSAVSKVFLAFCIRVLSNTHLS